MTDNAKAILERLERQINNILYDLVAENEDLEEQLENRNVVEVNMPETKYILNGKPVQQLATEEHARAATLLKELTKIYGADKGTIEFTRLPETGEDVITIQIKTKVHMWPDDISTMGDVYGRCSDSGI